MGSSVAAKQPLLFCFSNGGTGITSESTETEGGREREGERTRVMITSVRGWAGGKARGKARRE